MKKGIVVALFVAVALGIATWAYFHFWGTKAPVYFWRTAPVELGDLEVMVTATGTLNADTSVDVGTQATGIIAKIYVDFNAMVKKGQVLAILDTALMSANKVDAAAALNRANIQLAEQKREFARAKVLFNQAVTAKADYDLVFTSLQNAKGNVVSARALLNRASINLQYATIKAPISGMIINRNVQVGNMVIASFTSPTLFTIANDLKTMQVQANVDEADIGQVKQGQPVKFTVDAFPNDVFTGTVQQVRHQPVIVSNVVNYVVIVEVPNPQLKLMPGLTANLNISIKSKSRVLKIPATAFGFNPPMEYIKTAVQLSASEKQKWQQTLFQKSEQKKQEIVITDTQEGYVWLKRCQDIEAVQLQKGLSDGTFTEVTGNIKAGEEVVTGINQSAPEKKAGNSPFMPKFPSKKK